uniref:Protein kinase domain-containing protein n=1 Tax=Angiostrongylus cantonensis TaxID=6313 RepID=A0A0K0CU66_ANGCA
RRHCDAHVECAHGSPSLPSLRGQQIGTRLDFSNLQEIGRGGFGIVYAATQPNGERVALKKVLEGFAPFFFELVFFYEDFVEGSDTYVVMELCELGSMRSHVKKNGPLTDRAAAYVLRQIISAVKYMHREGVLHRDISCGNVLISRIFSSEKISVKLCDFGLATHLRKGETACTVVGTPGYIAPQVFKQEYDQTADVFSLGGVLYTILTGTDPPSKGKNIRSFYLFFLSCISCGTVVGGTCSTNGHEMIHAPQAHPSLLSPSLRARQIGTRLV